jgi:hypothetical protein
LLTPSVSMFIGQGLSLEARHAAQAERRAANTAMAAASAAAAAVAASTGLRRRPSGLRQRLRRYSLSPHLPKWIPLPLRQPARPQMVRPLLVSPVVLPVVWPLLSMRRIFTSSTIVRCVPSWFLCHGLTHDDGTPAIKEHPLSDQCRHLAYLQRTLSDGDDDDPHDGIGAPSLRSVGAMRGGRVMVVLRPMPPSSSSC